MASVLSYLRELNIVTMMLRILLAVLCGGLIGLERERKNRPAGFRTYMLTALGATLTVLLSLQLDQMLHGPWRALAESIGATQDVSRFGAEAAKGIGFLGAGTIIITARQQVKGLTTAAGLWASACLGLAIGAGFYSCAFICIAYMAAACTCCRRWSSGSPAGRTTSTSASRSSAWSTSARSSRIFTTRTSAFSTLPSTATARARWRASCASSAPSCPSGATTPSCWQSCRRSRASSSSKRSEKGGCTMLHCFDPIRDMTFWAILARLTLAVVCGGLIGAEREIKRRPAGFRTHILICLGSAITTLTSQYLLFQHLFNDIARLGAQVISGIGFVGAGTIIVTRDKRVKGLTTAAGLWAAAIIGLVCGAGYVECAIFATAVVLLVEVVLVRLEIRLTSKSTDLTLYIEYAHAVCMESVLALLRERSIRIDNLEISRISDSDAPDAPHHYCALIPIHSRTPLQPGDLRGDLTALPDMLAVEEM